MHHGLVTDWLLSACEHPDMAGRTSSSPARALIAALQNGRSLQALADNWLPLCGTHLPYPQGGSAGTGLASGTRCADTAHTSRCRSYRQRQAPRN
jgi:hypothetical protein